MARVAAGWASAPDPAATHVAAVTLQLEQDLVVNQARGCWLLAWEPATLVAGQQRKQTSEDYRNLLRLFELPVLEVDRVPDPHRLPTRKVLAALETA